MVRPLLLSLALLASAQAGFAQPYPVKPIRLIAPAPPGSPVDIRARWVAEKLAPAIGQPVVVENKAGAGGNIGTEAAARSAADGYTLVIVHHGTMAVNPHIYARPGYDPVADFAPIIRLLESVLMLAVHPQVPAHSVADLLRLARQQPGKLSFGSSGIGTPPHMAAELLRKMAGIDVQHVPYKGATPALTDLVAGRLAFTIDSFTMQLPQVKAGKLRALAVTGVKRVAAAPDVPTVAESGLAGYEYRSWMGVAAPAGTPKEIIARLNTELVRALNTAEARDWFHAQGAEIVADAPEEFAALIRAEYARWGAIIREAGIKAE
jgi:tripartite-type tricarboxylate transporter receptor subunit TctC